MISRFEQFSSSISGIYRCIQKLQREEMAKYGLKGLHAQCLLVMHRYDEGITAARLCEQCDKDKAAISRAMAELYKEGMVETVGNKESRYRVPLRLTAKGREAAERVSERAIQAVVKAGEGLRDEDRAVMYHSLNLLADNLYKISEEGF